MTSGVKDRQRSGGRSPFDGLDRWLSSSAIVLPSASPSRDMVIAPLEKPANCKGSNASALRARLDLAGSG